MSSGNRQPVWQHTRFGQYSSAALTIDRSAPLRVVFVIGSPAISGGTNVILQHAAYLAESGVDVTIATTNPDVAHGNWHPVLQNVKLRHVDAVRDEQFDVAIATWWPTIYELPQLQFRHALYFVQSIESRFYESDADPRWSAAAEATYSFGIPTVTIASWLQAFLAFEYEQPSFLVLNGIDKAAFALDGPTVAAREDGKFRILLEGHTDVPMKGLNEALEACRLGQPDEVWLLSPGEVGEFEGVDRVFNRVPMRQVAEIYRSCDALVKLSRIEGMYGPPLEMFHCGGTLVSWPSTGSEEYVAHMENAIVTPMEDIEAAAEGIRTLRDSPQLLAQLKHGAIKTAAGWPTWRDSSRRFLDALRLVAGRPSDGIDDLKTRIAQAHSAQDVWRG
jgi:glycosyltransferase involved in cell wall biosynthesis